MNILSEEFLSSYKEKQPNWGFNGLGEFVYKRTYSRLKADGQRENWWETVARCVEGAQEIGAGYTKDEAELLFDKVFNLKCNFAGRSLWQLGTETVKRFGANSLINCFYLAITRPEDFCFIFENLMLGSGVGFSVRREHIHELPKIKHDVAIVHELTKDADYICPDSRGGWIELLRRVLDSYFISGKPFTYSTILVRGYGEPIRGFGGTASGPAILIEGITNICKILSSRYKKKLRSIDVLDICNIIGSIVVAGNVRRSSEIAIGDADDHLFLKAKRWDLGEIPNWRAMSNNTIAADDFNYISSSVWEGYNGNGEPYGLINVPLSQTHGRLIDGPMKSCAMYPAKEDPATGGNPCQPGWAPLLTKSGIKQMKDIEEGAEIWSESGWTKVTKKWSSGIKKVNAYQTTAGVFFGTENHRLVCRGKKVEASECESVDILAGEFESGYKIDPQDVMDGLVFGDGTVHKASGDLVHLCIGSNDYDYFEDEVGRLIDRRREGIGPYAYEVFTTVSAKELPKTFHRKVPDRFFYGSAEKKVGFLRGVFSANGSIVGERVTLKATSFEVIRSVQMMLSSLGIRSYFTTNKPKKIQFDNGEFECKKSFDLNISVDKSKFHQAIGFIQKYKTDRLAKLVSKPVSKYANNSSKTTYDIVSIEVVSEEEVFDITVDNATHTYWTGGLNVSNCNEISLESYESCNLAELYLNNIESESELFECARLLYKTQKAICALDYISKETTDVVHRNFRLGLGVTGICQSIDKLEWLDGCYRKLRQFDKEWSEKRGWPQSIKLTTCKPSGTLSLLAGATPGIHPAYAAYYIRRVRVSSGDELVKYCKEHGYKTEFVRNFDGSEDRKTVVVEFPCQSVDSILAKDMSAVQQLELVKKIQTIWSDNSISVTVYYRKEEIPAIKDWLKEHYEKSLKTVSFLLHSDHGFQQSPYQEISEAEYMEAIGSIKGGRISNIGGEAIDLLECAGGACPIK